MVKKSNSGILIALAVVVLLYLAFGQNAGTNVTLTDGANQLVVDASTGRQGYTVQNLAGAATTEFNPGDPIRVTAVAPGGSGCNAQLTTTYPDGTTRDAGTKALSGSCVGAPCNSNDKFSITTSQSGTYSLRLTYTCTANSPTPDVISVVVRGGSQTAIGARCMDNTHFCSNAQELSSGFICNAGDLTTCPNGCANNQCTGASAPSCTEGRKQCGTQNKPVDAGPVVKCVNGQWQTDDACTSSEICEEISYNSAVCQPKTWYYCASPNNLDCFKNSNGCTVGQTYNSIDACRADLPIVCMSADKKTCTASKGLTCPPGQNAYRGSDMTSVMNNCINNLPSVPAGTNDRVDLTIDSYPTTVVGGTSATAQLTLHNLENRQSDILVECGIYDLTQFPFANRQGITSSHPTGNCQPDQSFVTTRGVSISALSTDQLTIRIANAPAFKSGVAYNLLCEAFERCWAQGVDSFITGIDVKPVSITTAPPSSGGGFSSSSSSSSGGVTGTTLPGQAGSGEGAVSAPAGTLKENGAACGSLLEEHWAISDECKSGYCFRPRTDVSKPGADASELRPGMCSDFQCIDLRKSLLVTSVHTQYILMPTGTYVKNRYGDNYQFAPVDISLCSGDTLGNVILSDAEIKNLNDIRQASGANSAVTSPGAGEVLAKYSFDAGDLVRATTGDLLLGMCNGADQCSKTEKPSVCYSLSEIKNQGWMTDIQVSSMLRDVNKLKSSDAISSTLSGTGTGGIIGLVGCAGAAVGAGFVPALVPALPALCTATIAGGAGTGTIFGYLNARDTAAIQQSNEMAVGMCVNTDSVKFDLTKWVKKNILGDANASNTTVYLVLGGAIIAIVLLISMFKAPRRPQMVPY